MTTTVRVNAPIPPKKALDWLTVFVGGDPDTVERNEGPSYEPHVYWCYNRAMQGLNALCDVSWHPDGPLPVRNEWMEPDEPDDPPGIIEISFDTPYAYHDEQGRGCGEWHRDILIAFRDWLAEQGVTPDQAWWRAGEYANTPNAVGGFNGPLSDLSTHV